MNSPNSRYCFPELPAFGSLSETTSAFALKIAGRPVYRHILEDWHGSHQGKPTLTIDDPLLANDIDSRQEIDDLFAVDQSAKDSAGTATNPFLFPSGPGGTKRRLSEPWHLLDVLETVMGGMESWLSPDAEVEEDTQIEGVVRIEAGARILGGTRIKGQVYIGRDVFIGNNTLIRGNTSLGAGCVVGYAAEIKSSLALEGASIGPGCAVPDSVLGKNCVLGGSVRISNTYPNGDTVRYKVDQRLSDTRRTHFGAIIGDHATLAGGVRVSPGRNVAPGSFVGPCVVVVRNVPPRTRVELEQSLRMTPIESRQ